MDKPRLNQEFPACAQVARRLLAEVYGCKAGDLIPGEAELLARARQVTEAAATRTDTGLPVRLIGTKAEMALAMVEEIGGIFETT